MLYKDKERKKKYNRQYRVTHQNEIKAYNKDYWVKNTDKMKACSKAYRARNPDKIKAYRKVYYAGHKEEEKAHRKAYYMGHREEEKAYRVKNKEKYLAFERKTNAKRRKLGFIPLNEWFEGSEAHHICMTFIIYIPKEMHQSIYHSIWTGEGMQDINNFAWNFLKASCLADMRQR